MIEVLTGSLQENVLCLLVFSEKSCPIIINSIDHNVFESLILKNIARQAIIYYEEFRVPPKEHIADLLEDKLTGKKDVAEIYAKVLENLYGIKDSVNENFVISRLGTFIRQQKLKTSLLQAVEHLENSQIDKAELCLYSALNKKALTFDPGLMFTDIDSVVETIAEKEAGEEDLIKLGINELDKYEINPAPKELFTFIAPSNRGKTWFVIHCAISALFQQKKVLHVSLEMSEKKLAPRYLMGLFAIPKHDKILSVASFGKNEAGVCNAINYRDYEHSYTLGCKDVDLYVRKRLESVRNKNLVIKEFPTGSLTVSGLRAYLEGMIRIYNFHPDLIIIDDPDNMKIDANNLRINIGMIYKELRGIGVEYNSAIVAVSQINREGRSVKWIDEKYIAEDISKYNISDNTISYNQTDWEYNKNLARLYVVKGRYDKKFEKILISQSYSSGQFCLDSALMNAEYFEQLQG